MKKLPKALVPSLSRAEDGERVERASESPAAVGFVGTPNKAKQVFMAANDVAATSNHKAGEWRAVHRSRATRIVERHANLAALGGGIPLALLSVAGVTAINLRMLKQLSTHYGVPFEREKARMIVVGLTGGCMPTGLATATTSALSFVVPAAALFGLAVCSVAASVCTRSIGRMFVDLFENGITWRDLPA